eukprot:TRINITY_DN6027_c0_g1_i1.p1 TRINITY_DN6027_c0_g1~~TRINITY_DN6027_c0_g1_i1.p1  ORF type:complete len:139 (-),score=8.76 TRINITY_DN6027_c0_g1_i1:174-590(-)
MKDGAEMCAYLDSQWPDRTIEVIPGSKHCFTGIDSRAITASECAPFHITTRELAQSSSEGEGMYEGGGSDGGQGGSGGTPAVGLTGTLVLFGGIGVFAAACGLFAIVGAVLLVRRYRARHSSETAYANLGIEMTDMTE